jgi:signal transduction histidine kinase
VIRSIRWRLLTLLVSGFLLSWLAVALLLWVHTRSEMNHVFDAQLVQIGRLLAATTAHEALERDLQLFDDLLLQQEYEYPAVFQVWSGNGRLLARGPTAPSTPLSDSPQEGFSQAGFDDEIWRVFTLVVEPVGHRVLVAHAQSLRDHLVWEFVSKSLQPLLWTVPLAGILWLVVDRELTPLRRVAGQIAGRDPLRLQPLVATRVPEEIGPLVNAVNELFERLTRTLDCHRRFTGDAAHELRTPLAGAITQLHAALKAADEEQRRERLLKVLAGLRQLGRLVDQLLTLSRAEPEQARQAFEPVDLRALAAEVIAALTPRALALGVEIELEAAGPIRVQGNAELLSSLLSNLLDNSVRATPSGGVVSVRLEPSSRGACLSVEDTGTGIPDREKARVLERFHRLEGTPGPGSGLGLSIVLAVARLHRASIALHDREAGPGLRVRVCFPPRAEA